MNTLGLTAALCAFAGIWFGHVAVRKIEFNSPTTWLPTLLFVIGGLFMEWLSVSIFNPQISIIPGILGVTLLFDAVEISRQQRRVCRGHAPANLHNPRHVKILAEHPAATTMDPLNPSSTTSDKP